MSTTYDPQAIYEPCSVCRSLNHRTANHVDTVTVSTLTEPSYLPTPSAHIDADEYMRSDEYIAMRAADILPSMLDADPVRAIGIVRILLDVTRGGELDDRTYRTLMARLSADGYVVFQTDEYPTDPIIADPLIGQILADGNATSPAPNYLSTTMGHKVNLAGEVRTFRGEMTIVDSFGNTGEAHRLVESADTLIRMFSADGTLDGLELIGTQDQAFTGTGAATGDYKPNGELRKATAASHGTGDSTAWHLLDSVDYVATETGGKFVPTWKRIDVSDKRDHIGRLTYKGTDGRTETTSGKCRYPMARMAGDYRSKPYRDVIKAQKVWVDGAPRPRIEPKDSADIRGCFDAATLNTYRTSHDGKVWHGWVRIERSAKSKSKPTTTAGRKAVARRAPELVNAATATERAAECAMELFNAHVGQTPNAESHAPTPRRFNLKTESGIAISIGLKESKDRPTGFDVVITSADGKRKRTTTSAPEYVEAIVRNRLALIG